MVNGNKGFMTLWLILVFLNAGLTKSFLSSSVSTSNKEEAVAHHNTGSKHDITATSDEESGISFIDQLKKGTDSDDLEFVFFADLLSKPNIPHLTKYEFSEFGPYRTIYRVPLYDLYCNWKFHLS
jgi:hypothetical protein